MVTQLSLKNKIEIINQIKKDFWSFPTMIKKDKHIGDDEDILLAAMRINNSLASYASERLLNDKSFALKAIEIDGYVLKLLSEDLKNDKEIVMSAVKSVSSALVYASEELRKDRELVLIAIDRNPHVFLKLEDEFKKDMEIVVKVVEAVPEILNSGKIDKELMKKREFIEKIRGVLEEFPKSFPEQEDILEEFKNQEREEMLRGNMVNIKTNDITNKKKKKL